MCKSKDQQICIWIDPPFHLAELVESSEKDLFQLIHRTSQVLSLMHKLFVVAASFCKCRQKAERVMTTLTVFSC